MQDLVFDFLCDDGTVTETYKPREAMRYLTEALASFDVDVNIARDFAGHLESAGFTNQIHDMRKVPVGTWPKDPDLSAIGDYCRAVNYDSLGAITNLPFTRGLGWSRLRVEVFLIEVRKDLLNNSFHPYHYYHSYSGQKPLQQEERRHEPSRNLLATAESRLRLRVVSNSSYCIKQTQQGPHRNATRKPTVQDTQLDTRPRIT